MQFTFAALTGAIRFTLQSPREAARVVIGLRLSTATGWTALALAAVVSTLLSSLALQIAPVDLEPSVAAVFGNPLRLALLQFGVLAVSVALVFTVGRRMGGTGDLAGTLAVLSWLEVIQIGLQVVQLAVMLVAPPVADVIGLFGVVLFFWLFSQFVAELHAVESGWRVFGAAVLTGFALSFALALLLVILGVAVHV